MSLGSILREARERKGLTIPQVAEQTRMIHQLVEEIENDDFHRITAPLYGRGFIKLFAECVDEDPAPLMQEFTEIYTGLRRPGVRTRPVQTPVESPEVAEPKDRNAPPPRPKVRQVVVADDPEEPSPAPVESPKAEVESPADTGRDAPAARPGGRFVETSQPVASKPVESPKSEVESPADTGRDAPTARSGGRFVETSQPVASQPVESPMSEVESPKLEVESPTDIGRDASAARPGERFVETSLPVASEPVESPSSKPSSSAVQASTKSDRQSDDSLLGDLFDLVARKRSQRSSEADAPAVKDESSVKISLPRPAPSWDDAPLEEEVGVLSRILRYANVKVIAAVLGGLVLLFAIAFGVVASRHSKPAEADSSDVSQATAISEPQPEPSSETLSTVNSQPSTPSAGDAAASPADGKSVYTANLVPPPDSYVE